MNLHNLSEEILKNLCGTIVVAKSSALSCNRRRVHFSICTRLIKRSNEGYARRSFNGIIFLDVGIWVSGSPRRTVACKLIRGSFMFLPDGGKFFV